MGIKTIENKDPFYRKPYRVLSEKEYLKFYKK